MSFREDFESFAKANGMDVLPLHPEDRIVEGRYYFEESTEKAYSVSAELCLKAEARIEELESIIQGTIDCLSVSGDAEGLADFVIENLSRVFKK